MVLKVYRENGTAIQNIKSATYKASVNSGTDLRPGCVASAYITIEVFGSQNTAPTVGEALTCYQVDQFGVETNLGIFYAEPAIESKTTYTITAYDTVNKLNADYSSHLASIQSSFPMTLADIVTDACNVAGVTCIPEDMPLYELEINSFYADGLTCRDILSYAAEINGQFVFADVAGIVTFSWYDDIRSGIKIYPTSGIEDDTTLIAYKQNGLEYGKYEIAPPSCVAVKPSDVEGAAYIYPDTSEEAYAEDTNGDGNIVLYNLSAVDSGNGNIIINSGVTAIEVFGNVNLEATGGGSTDDALVISGNLLLTGASPETYNAVAETVYAAMQAIPDYRPSRAKLFPKESPFIVGEIVEVTDSQGVSFYLPIMSLTISDEATEVEATGNETRSDKSPVEKSLANLAANIVQINRLKVGWAEIDEAIINTVEANELKSSDFRQSNDGIFAQEGMAIDLGEKTIKAEDFAVDAKGKMYSSAADISGFEFSQSEIYTNTILQGGAAESDYTMYGKIAYRTLKAVEIVGYTGNTIDARFEYYDGDTLVSFATENFIPVNRFYVPLYTGQASHVKIGLKLGQQTGVTIRARNVTLVTPQLNAPSNAVVDFDGRVSVGSLQIGSTAVTESDLITNTKFNLPANGQETVAIESGTRGVIMFSGYGTGARGLYFFACNSEGTVSLTNAFPATALTLSESSNAISVVSTSSYIAYGLIIYF